MEGFKILTEDDLDLKIESNEGIITSEMLNGFVENTAKTILEVMPDNPDEANINCFCLLLADSLKRKTVKLH